MLISAEGPQRRPEIVVSDSASQRLRPAASCGVGLGERDHVGVYAGPAGSVVIPSRPITRARMKSARLRGKAFNAPLHKPIKRLRGSRPTKAQIKLAVEQGIIDVALGEFEED